MADGFADFGAWVDGLARDSRFSGVVRVTRGGGAVFEGAWGPACRSCGTANTPDTRFATASVTKIFTAVAVLQLVEAGRLALDQRVHDVVDLKGSAIAPAVTVGQLLTHTSGIGDYFPEDDEDWPRVFLTTPTYTLGRVADFVALFRDLPARFAPGERFGYCNAGYVLLGRVIEAVTGGDYFDVVGERVFAPAGMTTAFFPEVDTVCETLAEPYVVSAGDGGAVWRKCVSRHIPPAPDGGLAASAADFDRFWAALLGGRLLGPEMVAAMLSPQVAIDDTKSYGYGVYVVADGDGVRRYEAHGFDPGVNAYIAHYPGPAATAVVLSNMDGAATAVFRALDEVVGA